MHFFNPAPVMKLVEIIRTVVTEPDVVGDVEAFAQRLGKTGVTVGDRAGFIANALLFGYLNHAAQMYESRYATREDIDAAMRLGCGLPMGPLALLDLIGLDTAYEILDTMYRQTPRPPARAGADPQADGHRRVARPQDRPRLLHLRRRRLARGRGRRADADRRRGRRRCPQRLQGRRGRLRARWPPASSRSSPRPATTWSSWPAARRRWPASAPRIDQSLDKAVGAAS